MLCSSDLAEFVAAAGVLTPPIIACFAGMVVASVKSLQVSLVLLYCVCCQFVHTSGHCMLCWHGSVCEVTAGELIGCSFLLCLLQLLV